MQPHSAVHTATIARAPKSRAGGGRPDSVTDVDDYMQTPDVPFHVRPAFSHSAGDVYKCGWSGEALGD